ncbi:ABC transporter transmembrane domain-containing protein, partial [Acinetobacter baumannii]|uniref:ABC transporter transmembrane domain-containing protein n=1 Tax=Acinetobacter baumannii TaxID=470 RepID=UPI002244442C
SETIQGYRVVRSFGGEPYEQHRFLGASSENTAKQLRMVKTNAVYTPSLQLVIYSAMAVLMFLVLLLRGDASAGDLVAYITLASKKFRKQSKKIQAAMGDVTHVASETIQGYRVVRSFGGEPYEQHRFLGASSENTA